MRHKKQTQRFGLVFVLSADTVLCAVVLLSMDFR